MKGCGCVWLVLGFAALSALGFSWVWFAVLAVAWCVDAATEAD